MERLPFNELRQYFLEFTLNFNKIELLYIKIVYLYRFWNTQI